MAFRKYLSASVFWPWERRIKHCHYFFNCSSKLLIIKIPQELNSQNTFVYTQCPSPNHRPTLTINRNKLTRNTSTASVILLSSCVLLSEYTLSCLAQQTKRVKGLFITHLYLCTLHFQRITTACHCVWPGCCETRLRAAGGIEARGWKREERDNDGEGSHTSIGIFRFTHRAGGHTQRFLICVLFQAFGGWRVSITEALWTFWTPSAPLDWHVTKWTVQLANSVPAGTWTRPCSPMGPRCHLINN